MTGIDFQPFPKISRYFRDIVITEKIDGTNAQVAVYEDGTVRAGSRNRWITPTDDNHGFARWVSDHSDELVNLGPGLHYGEWWGSGIQRGYGLTKGEKRFSLFNVHRWEDATIRPGCCHVVPKLYEGPNDAETIQHIAGVLKEYGSYASPGFMNPEGIIIFHTASNLYQKFTLDGDGHKEAEKQRLAEEKKAKRKADPSLC